MKRKFLLTFSGVLLLGLVGCGKGYSETSSGASGVVYEQPVYDDSTSTESQNFEQSIYDEPVSTESQNLEQSIYEDSSFEESQDHTHVLDEHGKCETCYVQVGTELTPSNIDEYLDISVNMTGLESETIMKVDVTISPRRDCEYHVLSIQAYFYSGKENRVHQPLVSESIFTEAVHNVDEYGYGQGELLVRPMSIRNGAYVKNPTLTKFEIDSVTGYVIE
ncbi:MAG: hypothetical protein J1F42_10835 [Lachnospiraceae bacterium]|nr:hypothetical protein [Lachnospiraceae bacterium]